MHEDMLEEDPYGTTIQVQLISINDVDIKNEEVDLTVALMMVKNSKKRKKCRRE